MNVLVSTIEWSYYVHGTNTIIILWSQFLSVLNEVSSQIPRSVVGGTTDCPTWRDKGVETVQLMLQGSRPLSTATILPAQGHHQLGSATAPWPPSAHHSMSLSSDDIPHKGRITIKLCYCRHFFLKRTPHYAWNRQDTNLQSQQSIYERYMISLMYISWTISLPTLVSHTVTIRTNGQGSSLYTGLFEMIVGVLTTCHTQYTWDRSLCIFFI